MQLHRLLAAKDALCAVLDVACNALKVRQKLEVRLERVWGRRNAEQANARISVSYGFAARFRVGGIDDVVVPFLASHDSYFVIEAGEVAGNELRKQMSTEESLVQRDDHQTGTASAATMTWPL